MQFSHTLRPGHKLVSASQSVLKLLLCLTFTGLLNSCNTEPELRITRAFYHWKSVIKISQPEYNLLDTLNTKKLYLKFFDIVLNREQGRAIPVAKLESQNRFNERLNNDNTEFVPVIFITNECFINADTVAAGQLAQNAAKLLNSMTASILPAKSQFHEIQVDCDWTAGTKDNYFCFLRQFRKAISQDRLLLTATIRLYQCKFMTKTGVPPVDRGMLMCYNMGNLREPSLKVNSILDLADLKQYTASLPSYPLDLDIALPLFDWKVLLRDKTYKGLVEGLEDAKLQSPLVSTKTGNVFEIVRDTVLDGYEFKKGDMLRDEQSETERVIAAGKHLSKKIRNKDFTLSLYHLDPTIIRKYTKDELEDIFDSMY